MDFYIAENIKYQEKKINISSEIEENRKKMEADLESKSAEVRKVLEASKEQLAKFEEELKNNVVVKDENLDGRISELEEMAESLENKIKEYSEELNNENFNSIFNEGSKGLRQILADHESSRSKTQFTIKENLGLFCEMVEDSLNAADFLEKENNKQKVLEGILKKSAT